MKIPFYGIDRFFKAHADNIKEIFTTVGKTGKMLMGEEVELFEQTLAQFCSRKYAIAVSSCTDALYFALLSVGVKRGDEVIVPSFSFIATATPIIQAGAVPVFTDIRPDTFSMDAEDLKKKITSKTKAIIFVHLYGSFCPIEEIALIAKENNIPLIEDNAHSLGSKSNDNILAGTHGEISCVSFDPTKIIAGFGTAGALLTDNYSIFKYVNKLRYQGKNSDTGKFDVLGFNSRISTFQGALLNYQLNMIDKLIGRRRLIADFYNRCIDKIKGIEYVQKTQSTFHKYVITTNNRDDLKLFLEKKGIQTMIHYNEALYEHPLFNNYSYRAENIQMVQHIKSTVLSLPIYPELTDEETSYITSCLQEFFCSF